MCLLPTDESCSHMHTRSHWLTYTRTVILAQKPIPLCTLVLGLALFTYIEYLVLLLPCSQRTASQRSADDDVNVGSTKSQRPPRLPPATNVLRTHTTLLTHTRAHSSLDVVGLVLRNLRARYPRSHSRSSARDTHIPQNSRTNSFVCCVHVLRPLRSADRTYERRQAGRPAETGPRVIPRCLPFLTVCPVCLPVCVWEWAFLLISICLCCCLFQFFDLYMVHNVLVCTSSPIFPLLLSSPLVSAQILCEV